MLPIPDKIYQMFLHHTKNRTHHFVRQLLSRINHEFSDLSAILQLLLLASIAIMAMLDCHQLAKDLANINMIYVGLIFFIRTIKNQTNIFTPHSIALLALALLTADIFATSDTRQLYINLAVIVTYFLMLLRAREKDEAQQLLYIISFPIIFTALHMVARSCFCLSSYIWNAWYATFIILGIWLLAKYNITTLKNIAPKITIFLLFIYTFLIIQMPAKVEMALAPFQAFNVSLDYGVFINTNFFAIYSALALIITIYFISKTTGLLKNALILIALVLIYFILISSWRPVWLGLIAGALFSLLLVKKRQRLLLIAAMLFLQIILFTTNVANYGDRFIELAKNISTEERNVIWRDAWTMQKTSSSAEWIYGHGLNRFHKDFKKYSSWHNVDPKKGRDFRSPHNVFLDVLYSSGILGIPILLILYFYLYKLLIKMALTNKLERVFACTILTVLTTTVIINGLNHSFFMMINIFPIAFICGTVIYLHENKTQTNKRTIS